MTTNDTNFLFNRTPRSKPVELAEPLWEKQKGESKKAFDAFVLYRDGGKHRSYAAVASELGKSKTLIERWGRTWHWVVRVAAYDRYLDQIGLAAEKDARQKKLERQAAIGVSLQTVAGFAAKDLLDRFRKTEALNRLVEEEVAIRSVSGPVTDDDKAKIRAQKKASLGDFDEVKLTAKDIAALYREGMHGERLVMGEPTEHRVDVTPDEILRQRIGYAVADARINFSEFPAIPLVEHLQWAAENYGVTFSDVLAAAGLQITAAPSMPAPLQITTTVPPTDSVS